MTIETSRLFQQAPWAYRLPVIRSIAGRISPRHSWVCPAENGLRGMLRAAHGARGASCVELMLHSSELMPGGSPTFRTAAAIERLYASLEVLFEDLSAWCQGLTLREFHNRMTSEAPA